MLMKKQFLSKAVPRGTRTLWRYLGALFILFTFAVGNVWGTATVYHAFAAAGDTIVDLEGTGSTPSAKFTAVNNTNWAAVSTSAKNNSIYRMNPSTEAVATSKSNTYGTKLGSSAKSTYKVTGVSNVIFYVGTGTAGRIAYLDVTENGKSKVSEAASVTLSDKNNAYKMSYALDASKSYTLEAYASADLFCYAVKFTVAPDCDEPATALSLSSNAPATIYAGTEITFSTSGGNGGAITIEGAASETITANKWTATEGEHTFTASQPKTDGKCAQEAELKLTVVAATPVSAVTVGGPANGYKNNEVIFAATAANATQYRWTVDGVAQGSDSAKLHFTPTESKTYSIVCEAKNAFNSDWIASTAHSLTVTSLYGELIRFVVDGGTAAKEKTGVLVDVATPEVSLTTGTTAKLVVDEVEYTGHKMDKGKYVGVKLTSGSFAVGDTVSFLITKATGSAKLYLYNTKEGTLRLDSINGSGQTGWVSFVLNQATTGVYLYRSNPDVKPYDQNPHVAAVSVKRPMAAKSVAYDLTAVKINGTAISAADLATLKTADAYLVDLMAGYAAAPVVKFARQTTTTYEDDSQKVATDTITVTASEVSSKWQAQATIGPITYTVKAAKQGSAKVYYYDGETKIGEETVAIGGHPAEYAAKQSKNLATFVGWYSDADLADGHLISDIAAEVISADKTVYGKWTYTYAQSVNVEKWVLDNTKTPNSDKTGALISLLGTRGFASNLAYVEKNLELDSLNDGKGTGRNYAYLGLKVKSAGKMLDFRLAKDNTVEVKFGNVGATPLLAINGGDYAAMTIEDGVFAYTATGNDYISIKTATDAPVVFQQIMIGEDIQDVTLPEATRHAVFLTKAGETEHGTLAVASPETYNWLAEGAAVTLTVAADEGYYIESVTLNGEALTPSENVYSFAMPNATANVVATFAEIVPNNVTYKANNGGEDADILEENATEIAGCSFTYAGHKFNGWNTAPDGTGNAYAEGDPVLSPLTLYAQWREYFVITYKDGDDVLDTEDVFVGEAPVGIADPVKAMNIFQGWTLAGSDEVTDVTALDATTTVYAKWEAIDACFYFSAKSVDASTSIAVDEEIDNANGGKVIAKTSNITYETLGVLVASSGSTYMKVELDYAMMEGTKISVKLAAGGTSTRGVNICYDADKNHKAVPMTWSATEAGEVKEFEYTLDSESALNGKKEFFIYRAANTYIQTVMVKDCAPQDYTVTYKDGETVLGTEQVFENEHPTADGINTHKKGYEFQGWAETVDGAVVDLDDITITAAKNLFAQYTVKDCSPMGVKFSMVPQPNELTSDYQLTGTTEQLIGEYAAVTGGVVYLNNNNSSNRVRITKTTSTIQLVSGDDGYIHVELDCPLKENDSIKFDNSERLVLAHNASKTSSVNIAKTDHFYIVPASWEGKYDFYIWRTGTGCTISGIEVVRPEIYTVSFNMMGHGSAIAPIDVAKGAKIVAPTAPTDENFAFAGWYKENTLSNAWDFDNDVVAANTTLYAKWLDMTDATLKSLKYGATDIVLEDGVYEYNVELPALSTSVPALTAETSNPNASADIDDATAFDGEGHATSTVTVTPEKVGAAQQVYIVNFSKAAAVELVDVTGNMTWDFSKDGLADNAAVGTEVVMANVEGFVNNDDFHSDNIMVTANKQVGTKLQASMIKFHTTVAGSVIVKCSNTGKNKPDRYLMVNGVETELHSTNQTDQTYAEYVPAGDVVLTVGGDGNLFNFTSVEFKLDNDLEPARTDNWLAPGEMGTICIPQGAVAVGADIYDLVGKEPQYGKIVFETIKHMKPGKPYMFISKGNRIDLILTDETPATAPDNSGAMKGTFTEITLTADQLENVYYFAQHALWSCVDLTATGLLVPANRAYVKLDEVDPIQDQTPAPGRVRMSLGVNGAPAVTTGVENAQMDNAPVKMIINGQLFILRGEKMFDATGRLVK